jgi:NADPH:quinone reductase-like Zn-dependent oxidoreductase
VAIVCDYHDRDWPAAIRAWGGGAGVPAAINATSSGETAALAVVADGGRLVTITGAPPAPEREVTIVDIYVQADGGRLARMAERLGNGEIAVSIGKLYGLAEAADALDLAVRGGAGGSVVLRL